MVLRVEERLLAAQTTVDIPLVYARKGLSLATAALAGAHVFRELAHHPRGDVSDPASGTRFFYHAHRHDGEEHGHFHLFRNAPGKAGFHHLAALSLDRRGWPIRWLTTNQWVTGETWAPANQLMPLLQTFHVGCMGRLAPIARWLTAMVRLYQPELEQLIADRDQRLKQLVLAPPGQSVEQVLEDRRVDVLSERPVDLPQTIAALEAAHKAPHRVE